MTREVLMLADVLAREKNVEPEVVFGALEAALAQAGHSIIHAGPNEAVAVLHQGCDLALGDAITVIKVAHGQGLSHQGSRQGSQEAEHAPAAAQPDLQTGKNLPGPDLDPTARRPCINVSEMVLKPLDSETHARRFVRERYEG